MVAAAMVIIVVVVAFTWFSSPPGDPDTSDPAGRVALTRYDNSSATFVVTKTSNPVEKYDNSSVTLVVQGHRAEPSAWTIKWTGSSVALTYLHENATYVLLIQDLDSNSMISNGDTFTLIALDGFMQDEKYGFGLWEPSDRTAAYLGGQFYNFV